jgi:hypothetical protein
VDETANGTWAVRAVQPGPRLRVSIDALKKQSGRAKTRWFSLHFAYQFHILLVPVPHILYHGFALAEKEKWPRRSLSLE